MATTKPDATHLSVALFFTQLLGWTCLYFAGDRDDTQLAIAGLTIVLATLLGQLVMTLERIAVALNRRLPERQDAP